MYGRICLYGAWAGSPNITGRLRGRELQESRLSRSFKKSQHAPNWTYPPTSDTSQSPRQQKLMKINPNATKIHKTDHKINTSNAIWMFFESQKSNSDPKLVRKQQRGNNHGEKRFCRSNVPEKLLKSGPEIHLWMKIEAWAPKYPFLWPQVPKDRPRVTQEAKVEKHWVPKWLFPKAPRITSLKAMSNGPGPAAGGRSP